MVMIKLALLTAAAAISLAAGAAEKPRMLLSDFQSPDDLKKWEQGDSGAVEASLAPRAATDANIWMKVIFNSGDYPGFSLKETPLDWTPYEALSFLVWTDAPYELNIRIDDSKSTDYKSRFSKTIKLDKGRNLCQILTEEVARVLNPKDIKRLIIFTVKPPKGLTLWFDDVALGARQSEQIPFIPYAERKDLQPKLGVVTPHLPFAKNLAGGPLNAFMLSGIRCGREVPELMQRLDLNVSLMTWDSNWDINTWGMGDFYGQRGHAFDRVLMQRYIASSMQGPEKFNVLILPTPIGWKEFPPSAREALLKRVKENGEGLVLIQPFPGEEKWPDDLLELSALVNCASDTIDPASGYLRGPKTGIMGKLAWKAQGEHPITRGIPFEALPFEVMSYQKYELAPGAQAIVVSDAGDPIVAVKQVGKGRVVTCAWRGDAITPLIGRGPADPPARTYRYWEVLYSLIGRSALWAGGREFARNGDAKPLPAEGVNTDENLSAVQWLDDKGKVTDWELKYKAPGADGIRTTAPTILNKQVHRGETITVHFAESGDVTVFLREKCNGVLRTIERPSPVKTSPINPKGDLKTYEFELPTDRVRQLVALVQIEVRKDSKLVARGETEVIVTPDGDHWDDYELFMWPVNGLPFLREFEDPMMREIGATGVMETGWSDRGTLQRWSRAGLRILPHDVDVRPLHIRPFNFGEIAKQYKETGDKKYLVRPNSFADPEFLAKTKEKTLKAAELLKPYFIPAYVLCDEPSLTSYREEFDFDFHPSNIALFRTALQQKFGKIDALNGALKASFKSFDEIEPPTTDEARKAGNWGLWNEWRAHNDTVMANGYKFYRDTLRQADPDARISISGTQTANPFDGFDWAKLSPLFDAMSGYGYGEQERTRMSFHESPMKNATPAGYGNSGRGVAYQLWNALTDHGCGHVLFWWVSFRNPDLTFCQSARDYQKTFAEIRHGIGRQYQLASRLLSPVAVQYSMNSMRAAYTQGKFDEYNAARTNTTQTLIDLGLDPVYVSDEQIAAGELQKRGIKAVFLPASLSIGIGGGPGRLDVRGGLLKFAGGGGLIFATHAPTVDEFLEPLKADANEALMQKAVLFDDAVKKSLGATLENSNIKPWVDVRRPDKQVIPNLAVTVHRLKGAVPAYIVTLLRRPIGQKEVIGADGVLRYETDPNAGVEIENCTVDVSALKPAQVTDIRAGKSIAAENGRFPLAMSAGDGRPFALLPYEIQALTVDAAMKNRDLIVKWQLARKDGAKEFAPHVVTIDITGNDGKRDEPLSQNATSDASGAGAVTIPLAEEDAGRSFKISVKDVLTGAAGGAEVKADKQ